MNETSTMHIELKTLPTFSITQTLTPISLRNKTPTQFFTTHQHHHHGGMSEKDCAQEEVNKNLYSRFITALLGVIIIVIFIIFLVWLILRPTKPHFVLQDATIYNFNLSSPNFLTTNLQITLSSYNPNERIGIYYDKFDVYASYHSQQITIPSKLQSTFQGHKDTTVWSPFLYGNGVPVAPYLALNIEQDQNAGSVLVNVRVDGRIRWKVGTFVSGRYRLYVNCPAYINFGTKNNGIAIGLAVIKYKLIMDCHVDV